MQRCRGSRCRHNRTDLSLCSAVEGAGVDLIELICLALSVLSRLLQLSPEGAMNSPIASSLSARPASRSERHLVTVVAQYIYHRHSPQLPSLATKFLSTLSGVSHNFFHMLTFPVYLHHESK